MARIYNTPCCALGRMQAYDNESKEEIERAVERAQKKARRGWYTTLQCVVTPQENRLRNNLKELGFKMVTNITRRACYGKEPLELYMLELDYQR